MGYVIGIGFSLILATIVSFFWVRGIDYMKENHPDYKGEDLTEDAILNMLRGRYSEFFPASKRLKTNAQSKIFLFFNGHGGDNFFKIQDT